MKSIVFIVFTLLSVLTSKSDAARDPNYKQVLITCNSDELAIKCHEGLKSILEKSPKQEIYTGVTRNKKTKNIIAGEYIGNCEKADEIARAIEGCSVQECPKFECKKYLFLGG